LNSFVEKRLRTMVTVFIQPVEGLPPVGLPEFRPLYYFFILVLDGLCRLHRGRSLACLTPDQAVDFLESVYTSHLAGLRAIPSLLGMPIFMAYYERDDIQPLLGFDAESLRQEAAQRGVER
jgi:hypothetical protein